MAIHRFPQSKYIDAVRWLSPLSAFDRYVVLAAHDPDSDSSSVEIHALNNQKPVNFHLHSSWIFHSRIASLRVSQTPQKPLIAASTLSGSLHFLFADPVEVTMESELSISEKDFHRGTVSGLDLQVSGGECVTVGEDGRVNMVSLGESKLNYRRVSDSQRLVSYTAARWASPAEFATAGLGFTLQWWDQRKPGGMVSQFKGNWARGPGTGIIHSIDIHPSRKHICVVGGSSGTVFAWDLRWQQQPIVLSEIGLNETTTPVSESEVWEVQYDCYMQSSNTVPVTTGRVLPVMMCSEDGILADVEQGEKPVVVLAEPCAINGFDIDSQNPSDVICSLEWEAVAILMRP